MSPELIEIAKQLPVATLLVIFVIYWSDRTQKSMDNRDILMRSFWDEQQKATRELLTSLLESLGDLSKLLVSHDQKTDKAVAVMQERTKTRKQ